MVDFDNINTYPKEIHDWVISNSKYFYSLIPDGNYNDEMQVASILNDKRLGENAFVLDYINKNSNMEFCVWHATRILDEKQFWNNGIVAISNNINQVDNKYKELFRYIGLKDDQIKQILKKMHYYWKRDNYSRIDKTCFFFCKELIKDSQVNVFAINIGGEIVRWALYGINKKLYAIEPYKRLWILGKPSIIKFKCKLINMPAIIQETIIVELIKYFVITELYNLSYTIKNSGYRIGSVAKEDILTIEEIPDFIKMQEEFNDYKGFYDELK